MIRNILRILIVNISILTIIVFVFFALHFIDKSIVGTILGTLGWFIYFILIASPFIIIPALLLVFLLVFLIVYYANSKKKSFITVLIETIAIIIFFLLDFVVIWRLFINDVS